MIHYIAHLLNCLPAVYLGQPQSSSAFLKNSKDEKQACSIAELLPLRLHYKVPWPLSLIVDDTVLLQYNQVLLFLLQVSFPHDWLHQVVSLLLSAALFFYHTIKSALHITGCTTLSG